MAVLNGFERQVTIILAMDMRAVCYYEIFGENKTVYALRYLSQISLETHGSLARQSKARTQRT